MQCSMLRGSCYLGRIRSLFSSADWGGGSFRCEFTCSEDVMPVHDAITSEGGVMFVRDTKCWRGEIMLERSANL